jgi:glyoxylase-like metal-dependent hydrolase (beta-lactamase superfamily II)/predicted ester cyclase
VPKTDQESVTPEDIINAPEPKQGKGGAKAGPAKIARTYFEALAARDLDAMIACWKSGGVDNIASVGTLSVPDGMKAFFSEVFTAMPDQELEIKSIVAARNQAAVQWRTVGTFCGGSFQGIEPTGGRIEMEGLDLLTIEDGLIVRNDAYMDGTAIARQIGVLPPQDSSAERGMTAAFNVRTKIANKLAHNSTELEPVGDGVWRLRGGLKNGMNVFLIEDEGGVTVFEAGVKGMTKQIASAAAQFGGVKRVILSHAHADHRGAAPFLRAPVYCHPDEIADAEGDGGLHYFDYSKLQHRVPRALYPRLLKHWDGGPVEIDGTVSEGDEIAGFKVIHLPGHAPGLIGLWRQSDRLAIVSDSVYFGDAETFQESEPVLPHPAFCQDHDQAAESLRKVIALDPAVVWSGHAEPLTEDIKPLLEKAASGWRPA